MTVDAVATEKIAALYRRFAVHEAAGSSPTYERLADFVARDTDLRARLVALPRRAWQPNLLFASVRLLRGPVADPVEFIDFVDERWDEIEHLLRTRRTQTNEVARCGVLLPLLASIRGPVALVEVGASAGLCLIPDRIHYRFDVNGAVRSVGPESAVQLDVRCHGEVEVPDRVPEVVWRAGVDLNPLDVSDEDDLEWLRACVWPEHHHRRERLDAAATIVASKPIDIRAGDLLDHTADLVGSAPTDATCVVFHSAVLAYLPAKDRLRFESLVRGLDAVWIANEGRGVVADAQIDLATPAVEQTPAHFVISRDGRATAIADPHGAWVAGPGGPFRS